MPPPEVDNLRGPLWRGSLFLLGAALVWREGSSNDGRDVRGADDADTQPDDRLRSFWQVAALGYGVIFVAEFGDLAEILTANLAAKYHHPVSVGIGATAALWSVGLLSMLGGSTLLRSLPLRWITRAAATILLALAAYGIAKVSTR